MPWKDTTTMEQKVEFICEWLSQKYTITELCEKFGITCPTGYRIIGRYKKEGIEGMLERSRALIRHPNWTKEEVEGAA